MVLLHQSDNLTVLETAELVRGSAAFCFMMNVTLRKAEDFVSISN